MAGSREPSPRRRLVQRTPKNPSCTADSHREFDCIDAVERCLHTLAERDRRVLVLTFYVEKTSSEIAEELGVTGTVVRVARHRALERLRECVRVRQGSGGDVSLRGTRTS